MSEVAPEPKQRRRRRRQPRTWAGRIAVAFGTSKRQVQNAVIPIIGLVLLLLSVYWVVRE